MKQSELEKICDSALKKCMPQNLLALIQNLRSQGYSQRAILTAVKKSGAKQNSLTYLACEAVLKEEARLGDRRESR